MKLKHTLFFALTIFAFASCNKEVPDPGLQQPEPLGSGISISATIGSETRTSIVYGASNHAAGETSEWVAGDIIHLYFYNSDDECKGNLFFEADSDGPVTTFSPASPPPSYSSSPASPPPPGNTYRVVALYCEEEVDMLDFNGQTQDGTTTKITHMAKFDPMKAELPSVTFDAYGNANINLSFSHLIPMLRFPITNNTGSEIKIDGIQIRSSNAANQFYSTADYSASPFHNLLLKDQNLDPALYLGCDHTIANSTSFDFYMMIPGNTTPVTTADLLITIFYYVTSDPFVLLRQEFNIPMSANAFLQKPFEGGKRYYFRLNVTGPNMMTTAIDGSEYWINTTTNTATLVEYTGSATSVVIPETVTYGGTDYNVVAIGAEAFWENTGLTSVTFAANSKVESIGKKAFYGCSSLTGSFTIPKSLISIGHSAFYGANITGLTFEPGTQLASIGEQAFLSTLLTAGDFTIPATVTYIGHRAFFGAAITSVTFESGSQLTTIGNGAFEGCSFLGPTFTIPAAVTFIGGNAFGGTMIKTLNMHCPIPPTLAELAFFGLDNSSLNVPLSAKEDYKLVLNFQSKGWDNSQAGDVGDLTTPTLIGAFDTARAYGITVTAVL